MLMAIAGSLTNQGVAALGDLGETGMAINY